MINEVSIARAKKCYTEIANEKDFFLEAVKAFGFFVADGVKNGLTPELSFGAAQKHFELYGQAMLDVAKTITIEMMPKATASTAGTDGKSD